MDRSQATCKVCRTDIRHNGTTTNLKTQLVRWRGENNTGDEESVDANVSNVTASTGKNMLTTWILETLSSHNSARSNVITASIARFIVKDLGPHSVVESDSSGDMISI